jgi:nitrogenase molybdenum-iron protein alpha/beta subunit
MEVCIMPTRYAVSRISTYSADNFGVASVLFELGGMVVIHDPSGCNSTYTTHDEPRWYDHDSLFFISGVTEMEALMGDDDKLIDDVVAAARDFSPRFIVLMSSPVSLMIGTDLPAICRVIEQRSGVPAFSAAPVINSMETYDKGERWAFRLLAEHFVADTKKACCCSWNPAFAANTRTIAPISVNILGVTPLDFGDNGSQLSLRAYLVRNGFRVQSCWSVGTNLEEIATASKADVTLVVADSAIEAAEVLQRRFGIPYVVGVPIGPFLQERIAADLRQAVRSKAAIFSCARYREGTDAATVLIGETVYTASLAAALAQEGLPATVYAPLGSTEGELLAGDKRMETENEFIHALKDVRTVIADPMYQPICPNGTVFIPLPHAGFSGRLYLGDIPNLIDSYSDFAAAVLSSVAKEQP